MEFEFVVNIFFRILGALILACMSVYWFITGPAVFGWFFLALFITQFEVVWLYISDEKQKPTLFR